MSLYPFLQLFVLYLESTQASCSHCSYREAAPDLGKQLQTLIHPLLKNLLIWRWCIVLACLYFLVLLSALSSALQNPVSLRYLKAAISLCFTCLSKLRSSLFLSHLQPNNFQTKNVQAAVLPDPWELVLGIQSHLSRKRPWHRMTFSFVSLGKECQSSDNIMKMSACKNTEEPRVQIHTMHSSLVFLYFSSVALFSFSLFQLITYLEVFPDFGATVKMAPYITQYYHRETHNLHQAWFLCLKPQENSPSQYKGLCDACLLHRAVKRGRFSFPALYLHKNHWKA